MEIGDRVYHKGIRGNGIVKAFRNSGQYRDTIGVEFWRPEAIETETTFHNLDNNIQRSAGLWCREDSLVHTPKPPTNGKRVSVLGDRGLARRIRTVAELPRRRWLDRSDVIINYGYTRHRVPNRDRFGRVFLLNRTIMSNKHHQCQAFAENGVPVPAFARRWFPGAIHKPLYSFAGRDIYEAPQYTGDITHHLGQHPVESGYYQQKINKVREFRAHVFLWGENKVPHIQEKTVPDRRQLCWNLHQGGEFSVAYAYPYIQWEYGQTLFNKIYEAGVNAVKSLGHDFGGADILMDENEDIYVVEVNSRCGLKERSLSSYKRKFWELYNLDIRQYERERIWM